MQVEVFEKPKTGTEKLVPKNLWLQAMYVHTCNVRVRMQYSGNYEIVEAITSLSATQINWLTIQKEAYFIFYCCQQLDYLIRDRKFTIHTDHMN